MGTSHTGLSANLGSTDTASTVVVGLDWIVQEESIFVEVVLWLFLGHPDLVTERELGGITVLDLVLVSVNRAWTAFRDVLLHSKFAEEHFCLVNAS